LRKRTNKAKLMAENPLVDSELVACVLKLLDELDSMGVEFTPGEGVPITHTEMRPDEDSQRKSEVVHLIP
jgi:hypothetical protein